MRNPCPSILVGSFLLALTGCSDSGDLPPPDAGADGMVDTDAAAVVGCGDGELRADEACEGFELRGETCESQGFTSGRLSCSDQCAFDTSGCFACGNDVIEGGEACDGDDLDGASCAGLLGAEYTGSVVCAADCAAVDTSGCTPTASPSLGLGACDPAASTPCADALDCIETTLGAFCAEECDPDAAAPCDDAGAYCFAIDDTGVCRPKPQTGEPCAQTAECAVAGQSCEALFVSDEGERSVCAATCSPTQINRSADTCGAGQMCVATPGKRVELQAGDVMCVDASACDAGYECLDVGAQASEKRCARYAAVCGEVIPPFAFHAAGNTEASLCDRDRPTLGARYCGLNAGSTSIANPAVVECYPYFADSPGLGVCVAYCDAAFGGGSELDCGTDAECVVPTAPELFVSQSSPAIACTLDDTTACDGAHDRCVDLGSGLECARALKVCAPSEVAP